MRTNTKELLVATLPFTQEDGRRSRREIGVSIFALAAAIAGAAWTHPWPLRAGFSALEGLLIVRCFGLYHDVLHGALGRRSKLTHAVFWCFGVLVLAPPRVWKQTHNYHHAHTAQLVGSHVGSFVTVNLAMWRSMSPLQRWKYRAVRSGFTVLLGYPAIFLYGMCLSSFLRGPKRFWDSGLAIAVHLALVAGIAGWAGWQAAVYTVMLPLGLACALGAYLFYAQHNYPAVAIQPRESWRYSRAALESSSYIEMGPVMRWFTANLGYHHVHHLNPAIPFYRLPEAMAALPELAHPGRTTLKPWDIARCLSLGIWNEQRGAMTPAPTERPT